VCCSVFRCVARFHCDNCHQNPHVAVYEHIGAHHCGYMCVACCTVLQCSIVATAAKTHTQLSVDTSGLYYILQCVAARHLCCSVLQYVVAHHVCCSMLQCVAARHVCCSALRHDTCVAVCCGGQCVLQCVMCCGAPCVLQCAAVRCSAQLLATPIHSHLLPYPVRVLHVAVYCSVLQCVAVYGSVMQCTIMATDANMHTQPPLQHTATHQQLPSACNRLHTLRLHTLCKRMYIYVKTKKHIYIYIYICIHMYVYIYLHTKYIYI